LSAHHRLNREITDLGDARAIPAGKPDYVASFRIRKPVDMGATTTGVIWHDVPNRGGDVAFPPTPSRGDMQLLSGWQGDNAGGTRVPAGPTAFRHRLRRRPAFANHYVKTPVLVGTSGRIVGRIINRSGLNGGPLNVMATRSPTSRPTRPRTRVTAHPHLNENLSTARSPSAPPSEHRLEYCGGGTFDAPTPVTALPVNVCLKGGFDRPSSTS